MPIELQRNLKQNASNFILENALKNVSETASILSWPQDANFVISTVSSVHCYPLNSSPNWQNGRHFADDIFVNKKFCILIEISLVFVLKGPNNNNPALV